jgi:hypothetical protein
MIYKTLAECLNECEKTGVLRIEGVSNDQYTLRSAGFRPRLVKTQEKRRGFFAPIP